METDAGLVFCVFATQEQVSLKDSLAHHGRFTQSVLGENAEKIVLEYKTFRNQKRFFLRGPLLLLEVWAL